MTVLVFGAGGGVGAASARALHKRGLTVHLAARDRSAVAPLAEELGAEISTCDVLVDADLERTVAEAAGDDGLTGLVFAVGSIVLAPLAKAARSGYREAFELNVVSAAQAMRYGAPSLKKAGGAAVLFSSVAAGQGFANHAVISAAKAGVEGLSRALAAELAPQVRVNVIAPSLLGTKMAQAMTSNEKVAEGIAKSHPLPRLGRAEDAASLAAFLISEEASWITGQVFNVDGGRSTLRIRG